MMALRVCRDSFLFCLFACLFFSPFLEKKEERKKLDRWNEQSDSEAAGRDCIATDFEEAPYCNL
jgi:hypothetical protein